MKAEVVVNRAHFACDKGTRYKLGKGGMNPGAPLPSAAGGCDCSGFVAWCLGMSRQTKEAFYKKYNNGWIETTAVAADIRAATGIFDPLAAPKVGCVVVYGDYKDAAGKHREGHIAIVTEVNGKSGLAGISRIVHCSVGNDSRGDAIQETSPSIFVNNPQSVMGWCITVDAA